MHMKWEAFGITHFFVFFCARMQYANFRIVHYKQKDVSPAKNEFHPPTEKGREKIDKMKLSPLKEIDIWDMLGYKQNTTEFHRTR